MRSNRKLLALAIATAPLWLPETALGQQGEGPASEEAASGNGGIEEVVVTARLKSAAESVVTQRLENEAAMDMLSADMIGRIGDSNVATALRRVPGVTLVDDRFIYVRGLGERYSSTLLNGAVVPSPDLTRSVLPLDIFPTSIVETLSVQKTYTSDMRAEFGGGNVDIQTRGIPDDFLFSVELGTKYNTDTTGSGLTYDGGDDDWLGTDDGTRALPGRIRQAFQQYQGEVGTRSILNVLQAQNSSATLEDARNINQELAKSLYRDISVYEDDVAENIDGEVNVGNRFYMDNGVEFGFLAGLSYDQEYETKEITSRIFSDPEEQLENETESTRKVNLTGNLDFGLRVNDEQKVSTTSLFLRNTDDETTIADFHNSNRPVSSGLGFRDYGIRFEEREMEVHQIKGSHTWGEQTRELLGMEWLDETLPFLDQLQLDWYYSDSTATTEIPSETSVVAQTVTDPGTGEVISSRVQRADSMATYRFTDLEDEVESQGWTLTWPVFVGDFDVELSGGWDYVRKNRVYRQTDLRLGTTDSDVIPVLDGELGEVFSDENIDNDAFGFELDNTRTSSRSYIAATTNEAMFFQTDATWRDTWRFVLGTRYEEYIQVGVPWDPLAYNTSQISMDPDELRDAVFTDDAVYPAASLIYMRDDFWAETFQLRFGYSETVVRPDLREIADTSYLDPVTDALVFGNPDLVPADVTNYDLRAEWFFDNGDNLTASLFWKDIDNPIEFFERAASDVKVASEVVNAESAELYGVEFEWLKELSFLGDAFSPFFLSGNLTFLEHELTVGGRADSPTNPVRGLAGASDYAANIQLGYDSDNGEHSAMLVYNVFGERLYTAGRLGEPDSFEQPFHSLDMTYSWYPLEPLTVKAKLKNILDETVTIERGDTEIYEEQVGVSASLSVKWDF